MNTRILAATLVVPLIAFGPATAWAHRCSHYHHHHHARGVDKEKYGSSRQMQKDSGSTTNQGTGAGQTPGATDQGTGGSSGSSSSGGRGGI